MKLQLYGGVEVLVKDMIEAIIHQELKIDDLAKKYGFSNRTIQARIKGLGFVWDAKEVKYKLESNDKSVLNLHIDEVFKSKVPNRKESIINSNNESITTAEIEVIKASKEAVATTPETTSVLNSVKTSNKAISKPSPKAIYSNSDNIDRLLAGKKAKKTYRGFYFDSDILAIIDNVDNGVKSELINECLRKVFKEKGLL